MKEQVKQNLHSGKKEGSLRVLWGVIFMTSALQHKRREKAGLEKMFRKITEILQYLIEDIKLCPD